MKYTYINKLHKIYNYSFERVQGFKYKPCPISFIVDVGIKAT